MMIGVISHVNQYMRKQLAKATHDRMISIAARGEWPAGRAPFGYRRREPKNNILAIDTGNAAIVRDIFRMYASSDCETMAIARKYFRILSKNTILNILHNPIYIGKIRYGGQEFDGKHEPIIDAATYARVQDKMPNPEYHERPKSRRYPYLLAGLLRCSCGRALTPQSAKSGQYAYYVCGDQIHRHVRVSATKLDEMAVDYIRHIEIDKEVLDAVVDQLREDERIAAQKREPELRALRDRMAALEKEKQNIVDTLLSDGRLHQSIIKTANERVEKLDVEISAIAEDLERLTPMYNQADLYKAAVEFVAGLNKFSQLVQEQSDPDTLRLIIRTYIDRVEMREDGSFAVYPNSNIISSPNPTIWQPRLDSNQG
ncbi:MAG: recombinase family protein [Lentisphaeria bacterium]|nr:recombinase family protein [Lentisphaeria bacterium]